MNGLKKNGDLEQNFTKKELIDKKREEKQRLRDKVILNRKIKKATKWLLFIIVLIGLIYWGISAIKRSDESRPGKQVSIQGKEHIHIDDKHEEYSTNPPTSGSHSNAVRFGIYEEELRDENVIHNLEHGGIWISYKNISDEEVSQLEIIAEKHPRSVVLSPRNANDTQIAVVSWGRIMKLETVDENLIEEYINRNINKSPEKFAR